MVSGLRAWLAVSAALIAVVAVTGAALVTASDESTSPPRVRVSVPGMENQTDLFAQESEPMTDTGLVTEIDGIEPLRVAFDADRGHPRMILLVDPT